MEDPALSENAILVRITSHPLYLTVLSLANRCSRVGVRGRGANALLAFLQQLGETLGDEYVLSCMHA